MDLQTEVLIIGGGATGAGISRDLALRGIPSLLVEKDDFTSGASGRNQGLLHSGARYAVNDLEAARECITENRILRRIAPHCIESHRRSLRFTARGRSRSTAQPSSGPAERRGSTPCLSLPSEALSMEPKLNPRLIGAVQVPDGAIDPFTLVVENARDAESRGARFLLHTEVIGLDPRRPPDRRGAGSRTGSPARNLRSAAPWVINATGRLGESDPRARRPQDRHRPLQGLHADHQHPAQRAGHQPLPPPRKRRHHRPERHRLHPRNHLAALGGSGTLRGHPGGGLLPGRRTLPDDPRRQGRAVHPRLRRRPPPRPGGGCPRRPGDQPRFRPDRPRKPRRPDGADHHHRRKTDDLPPHGGKDGRLHLRADGPPCALHHPYPAPPRRRPEPYPEGPSPPASAADPCRPGGTPLRLRARPPGGRGRDPPGGKGAGAPGHPPPHPSRQGDLPGGLLRLPPPGRPERNATRDEGSAVPTAS